MPRVGLARLGGAFSVKTVRAAFLLLVLAGAASPLPEALAQTTSAPACPTAASPAGPAPAGAAPCPPPPAPVPTGPTAWGVIGLSGLATGLSAAANGQIYQPLLSLGSDINYGLLPNKQLYLFLANHFGVQQNARRGPGVSQRVFDAEYGLAWNYWDSLELRVFGYALNNLNRGTSRTVPEGFKDGVGIANRYYFHYPDIYDITRLGFIDVGYYPSQALVGNNGQSFKPSVFAHAYLTESLPTPFTSFLYGGLGVTGEQGAGVRLFGASFGIGIRPIADRQNLQFSLGDAVSDDLKAGVVRNYVYGSVQLSFEAGPSTGPTAGAPPSSAFSWPEAWGEIGLPVYFASSHMAPNGEAFAPVFTVTSELNLGLLPHKQLYFFWDGAFWGQHSATGITNAKQGAFDFSKREMDSNLGLAWNYFDGFELRASVYALNNLNRGVSLVNPVGGKEGVILENRYNFATPDPYDVGRSSFVGIGYIPTENLVGDNGASFRPGPFVRAYLARDLPIPWLRSYLYAGLQFTAEHTGLPRLFDSDVGWAVRPIAHWQNLEFRIGDDLSQDIVAAATRNLIYGAIRLDFGPGGFRGPPH
jgi:hypothetical protein